MPMMSDEQQTAVRRSRWRGQPGQAIRMAGTVPDEDDEGEMDEEEDIDDEEDLEEEDLEEEDIDEEEIEEVEDEEAEAS
jgi:hypothetical protein